MSSLRTCLAAGLAAAALLGSAPDLSAGTPATDPLVVDGFEDGNDDGWSRYESGTAAPVAFSFPGGSALRLDTGPAAAAEPARAGITWPGVTFGRPAGIEVRLTDIDPAVDQIVGLLGCATMGPNGPEQGYVAGVRSGPVLEAGIWELVDGDLVERVVFDGLFIDFSEDLLLGLDLDRTRPGVVEFTFRNPGDTVSSVFALTKDYTHLGGTAGLFVQGSDTGGAVAVTVDDVRVGSQRVAFEDFDGIEKGLFWSFNGVASPTLFGVDLGTGQFGETGTIVSRRLAADAPTSLRARATFGFPGDGDGVCLAFLDADAFDQDVVFGQAGPAGAGSLVVGLERSAAAGVERLVARVDGVEVSSVDVPANELAVFFDIEVSIRDGELRAWLPFVGGSEGLQLPPVDLSSTTWVPRPVRLALAGSSTTTETTPFLTAEFVDVQLLDVAPGVVTSTESAGSGGTKGQLPWLQGVGSGLADEPYALVAQRLPANSLALLFLSATRLDVPFKGGVLVPAPDLSVSLTTNGAGHVQLEFPWDGDFPVGIPLYAQLWSPDAGVFPSGVSSTNGLGLRVP